jgi:hypothetical protein
VDTNWELSVHHCKIGFRARDQAWFQINGITTVLRFKGFAILSLMTIGSEPAEVSVLARQKILTVGGIVQLILDSFISTMESKFAPTRVSTTISFTCCINQYLVL